MRAVSGLSLKLSLSRALLPTCPVAARVSTYMKKYQNWSTPSYTCDINDNNLVVRVSVSVFIVGRDFSTVLCSNMQLLYADTGEPVKHYTRGRRNERRLKLCRVAVGRLSQDH